MINNQKITQVEGTFKGIPYTEIINSILVSLGYSSQPAVGERNNALYALVRNLRYVCDFNVEQIISILPDWGLPADEVRRTVESAVKSTRQTEMPQTLQTIIDRLLIQYSEPEDFEEEEEDGPWNFVVQPEGLIGDIVKMYPEKMYNAVYLTAMCCFGTLLTRLRGRNLDGKMQAPNFMVCIQAHQAAGKSFMKDVSDLIIGPIQKHDDELRKQLREIMHENSRNKGKEGYEEKEFQGDIRILPTNISNRMLLERTDKGKSQHLMIIAEEVDSITKAEKTGKWSEKSDIYRLAFDNSLWGMDYANDNSYTASVHLYLNLLFSGTPVSVDRFFNDVENGLVTRFLFVELSDNLGMKRPKMPDLGNGYIESIKQRIQTIYDKMKDFTEENFEIVMDTDQMRKDVLEYYEEPQRRMYLCNQSNPCRAIVYRRYSIYALLFMMIETWLNDGVYTESIRDRVIGAINYYTEQLIALYGDDLNRSLDKANEVHEKLQQTSQKTSTLDKMENMFTVKEYEQVLMEAGIPANNSGPYIKRLVDCRIIERVSRGIYRKLVRKVS